MLTEQEGMLNSGRLVVVDAESFAFEFNSSILLACCRLLH
ncbi:hypothetical protein EV13_1597 [Prochlorococcus sp. MIT 0702]|nr:hypothetical protein EV13_1597 [Prochlorococcus sp. MIT 0702]KGG28660.1 hypothetical protein EV12_0555 [Prochlorococcus sp. MIT 0701]KGG36305.1 hypothetical protein EV14_0399 [Prochlorococcus sp. MIT 0703]